MIAGHHDPAALGAEPKRRRRSRSVAVHLAGPFGAALCGYAGQYQAADDPCAVTCGNCRRIARARAYVAQTDARSERLDPATVMVFTSRPGSKHELTPRLVETDFPEPRRGGRYSPVTPPTGREP